MENTNNKRSIVKGAMILGVATLLSKIIGLIYRVPLTNILGDEGNALYGSAFQIYIILITLSAVAFPSAISKLVSERIAVGAYKDAHRVYKIAVIYTGILGAILSAMLWFGADWIAINILRVAEPTLAANTALAVKSLAPTIFIVSILAVMRGYFQGLNSMASSAISQVIEQVFNAVFSVVLAYALLPRGIQVAVVGSTLGTGIGAASGLIFLICAYMIVHPRIKQKIEKSSGYAYESTGTILKKILVTAIPIVIGSSVFAIMTTIDFAMLREGLPKSIDYLSKNNLLHLLPMSNINGQDTALIIENLVGQYSGKYLTLVNVPVGLILTLAMAATPAIAASMAIGDYKDVRKKTKMVLKVGNLFAAPAAVGLALFAKPILALLFSGYPDGGELLAHGAIAIVFITIAQLTTGILQGMGKQHIPTINATIACIIKVILNFILISIPRVNIYGIIYSTTICYMVYAFFNVKALKKHLNINFRWGLILVRPLICAAVMGAVSYGVYALLMLVYPSPKLWVVVIIPFAGIVYGAVGILSGTITKKDLASVPGGNKLYRFIR